jgi:hypothetical protein
MAVNERMQLKDSVSVQLTRGKPKPKPAVPDKASASKSDDSAQEEQGEEPPNTE